MSLYLCPPPIRSLHLLASLLISTYISMFLSIFSVLNISHLSLTLLHGNSHISLIISLFVSLHIPSTTTTHISLAIFTLRSHDLLHLQTKNMIWMFRRVAAAFNAIRAKTKVKEGISIDSMVRQGKISVLRLSGLKEGDGFLGLSEKDYKKLKLDQASGADAEKKFDEVRRGMIEKMSEGLVALQASEFVLKFGHAVSQGPKSSFQTLVDNVTSARQRELEANVRMILFELQDIREHLGVPKPSLKKCGEKGDEEPPEDGEKGDGEPPEDVGLPDVVEPPDIVGPFVMPFVIQLCSGMDENAVGTCVELIFAPIDSSFADDAPLLATGFCIIPLDSVKVASSPNCTLDLASAFEIGPAGNRTFNDYSANSGCMRSVMTIAFEFAFESHFQDHVASMARQYVHSIISSVQRVALALSPSHLGSHAGLRTPLGTSEAQTLAHWICHGYRCYMGVELLKSTSQRSETLLKTLWHHSDAIMCCSLKALPVFTFSNQAGLDMLETTLVALQDIALEKIFDDHGQKTLCSEFLQIMQQGFACLQSGICLSSMRRPVSYERAVAWKVLNEEENAHCICFMFINWSFV